MIPPPGFLETAVSCGRRLATWVREKPTKRSRGLCAVRERRVVVGANADSRAIFFQVAGLAEPVSVADTMAVETLDPSINGFSCCRMNDATMAQGVNLLAARWILDGNRGGGTYAATGDRGHLLERMDSAFIAQDIKPLVSEANRQALMPRRRNGKVRRPLAADAPERRVRS
ncbi:hypothetical protein DQ353_06415 [Arthrobacter sp. AQ5-05]|nr:hypothetical protein DQ353_06415 [Arthrobacter sp. AQ5-05]